VNTTFVRQACALAAGLALVIDCASAQPAVREASIDLTDALEAAWQRTTRSREAVGQANRAKAEQSAAMSIWSAPPVLELSYRDDRWLSDTGAREAELGVALPLWFPNQRAARLKASDAQAQTASGALDAARLHVAGQVREAAWDVLTQETEVLLAQAQFTALSALAEDVDRRVAAGDLARADALASRAEMLGASGELAQARQHLERAVAHWVALTGQTALPVASERTEAPATAELSEAHPALRAASLNVELARSRLVSVEAGRNLPPELVTSFRHTDPGRNDPSSNSIGVAVRLPLGTAGRHRPQLVAAQTDLDVAQANQVELRIQLQSALATARSALDSTTGQLSEERSRAALLRERAKLIDKSFRAGQASLPDLLRAEAAARQAEAGVRRQETALGLARARLNQALGVMP